MNKPVDVEAIRVLILKDALACQARPKGKDFTVRLGHREKLLAALDAAQAENKRLKAIERDALLRQIDYAGIPIDCIRGGVDI